MNNEVISREEMVSKYRKAAGVRDQMDMIKTLSELTASSQKDVVAVLVEEGVDKASLPQQALKLLEKREKQQEKIKKQEKKPEQQEAKLQQEPEVKSRKIPESIREFVQTRTKEIDALIEDAEKDIEIRKKALDDVVTCRDSLMQEREEINAFIAV